MRLERGIATSTSSDSRKRFRSQFDELVGFEHSQRWNDLGSYAEMDVEGKKAEGSRQLTAQPNWPHGGISLGEW